MYEYIDLYKEKPREKDIVKKKKKSKGGRFRRVVETCVVLIVVVLIILYVCIYLFRVIRHRNLFKAKHIIPQDKAIISKEKEGFIRYFFFIFIYFPLSISHPIA
jgi:Ca2+/H+ antiporter